MCRQKQAYDYSAGIRISEPMVACSFHMPESLWKALQEAKLRFGVDGVVICRNALGEHLRGLGIECSAQEQPALGR